LLTRQSSRPQVATAFATIPSWVISVSIGAGVSPST
jgi:hypothetical protein